MRTTFPRRPVAVNGSELSHPVAPPRDGKLPPADNRLAPPDWAFAQPVRAIWQAAMVLAAAPRKRRRSYLIALRIHSPPITEATSPMSQPRQLPWRIALEHTECMTQAHQNMHRGTNPLDEGIDRYFRIDQEIHILRTRLSRASR